MDSCSAGEQSRAKTHATIVVLQRRRRLTTKPGVAQRTPGRQPRRHRDPNGVEQCRGLLEDMHLTETADVRVVFVAVRFAVRRQR